jgi:hypothetical protein
VGKDGSSEAECGRGDDSRMGAATTTIQEESGRRFLFIYLFSNTYNRAV